MGDYEMLNQLGEQYGFRTVQVSAQYVNGVAVSSTKIRNFLWTGNVKAANDLLGYPYSVTGTVVLGNQIGRTLGFPTANVRVPAVLTPPDGVYATCVTHRGQTFPAVTNIGFKPTFGGRERTIESFILDCDRNLYDETIHMGFLGRLRGEKRFAGPKELATQIAQDIKGAHAYFDGI
jgi:riboflavin kinase/FMN adenylyltransferase